MSDLAIVTPCPVDWDAMTPRDEGRHCAACDRVVIDVCSRSEAEQRRLFDEMRAAVARGERVCARVRRTPQGYVIEPRPAPGTGRRVLTNGMAAMLAVSAGLMTATAAENPLIQGAICAPQVESFTATDTGTGIQVNAAGAVVTATDRHHKTLWQLSMSHPVTELRIESGRLFLTTQPNDDWWLDLGTGEAVSRPAASASAAARP